MNHPYLTVIAPDAPVAGQPMTTENPSESNVASENAEGTVLLSSEEVSFYSFASFHSLTPLLYQQVATNARGRLEITQSNDRVRSRSAPSNAWKGQPTTRMRNREKNSSNEDASTADKQNV